MNARTSVLYFALLFCTAAAVLALRPWQKSACVESEHSEIVESESSAISPTTVLAETGASVTKLTLETNSIGTSRRHIAMAADADGDATISPLEDSCSTEDSATRASAPLHAAGSIRGMFVREGAAWTESDIPAENTVILDLASLAHPTERARRAVTHREASEAGSIAWTFEFADVAEGEYLLTLSALGARRWSPTSLHVRAPMNGIVFTRFDKDRAEALEFEVVDAETNAPVAPFDARHIQVSESKDNGVFLHTGPLSLDTTPLDAHFQWSLHVEGYATAFGDETAFERRAERRVASVRLVRGWSSRVFVLTRDPTGRPAAGAEVLLDGVRAGFTATDGMLVVAAAVEPAKIDVKLAGFLFHSGGQSSGDYTARQRGGVTVVMLDRE